MLKSQVKIEVKILVHTFIYIRTLCMRAAKALASQRKCVDSHEPSLFTDAISTEISCTVPYIYLQYSIICGECVKPASSTMRALSSAHCTDARGKFNNASALGRSLY